MQIYLAIKYDPRGENRPLIEEICGHLTSQGHQVTCVVRDIEKWGAITYVPAELMRLSLRAIDNADLVLVEFSEKGVGLGIEAGYAHAQGKPMIVVARQGSAISTTMQGIADQVIFYERPAALAALALPVDSHVANAAVAWPYAVRSVERLLACLDGLSTEAIHRSPLPSGNSLSVLATHMIGNIEETVWGVVCGHTVARDRAAEFQASGVTAAELQERWQQLCANINGALATMSAADLAKPRQHPRRGALSANEIFVVVARHAAEHLAQAEMTRELLDLG